MTPVQIPRAIFDRMIAHCMAELPNEACGFLSGIGSVAQQMHGLVNADLSPTSYRARGKELIAAFESMDSSGTSLLAIFHSHPNGPPRPSPTDIAEARYSVVHIVIGLADPSVPRLGAFDIKKDDWWEQSGTVTEVEVVIV